MRIGRREGLAVAIGFVLVGAAFVLPRLNLGIKPRSDIGLERFATRAGAAPIFGYWDAHVGWGTAPAVLTAVAVVECCISPVTSSRITPAGPSWAPHPSRVADGRDIGFGDGPDGKI